MILRTARLCKKGGKRIEKQLTILYLYKNEAQNYVASSRVPSRVEPDTVTATKLSKKRNELLPNGGSSHKSPMNSTLRANELGNNLRIPQAQTEKKQVANSSLEMSDRDEERWL